MNIVPARVEVGLLNWASKQGTAGYPEATAYIGKSKLEVLMGRQIWEEIRGRTVLDFGCGPGAEAVEMAERGAAMVIGLDVRPAWLLAARELAARHGVSEKCVFAREWHEPVDVITSLDSFEHFADPADILRQMANLLKPGAKVLISFGPTWYHPLGGHIFSVFPWAHLLFSERALVRWRSLYKSDGARTIEQAGLNKMSIRRFRRLIEQSAFRFLAFEAVPIRRLARLNNALTREFTTSIVRCTLVKR